LDPTRTNTTFITAPAGNLTALFTTTTNRALAAAVKGVVLYDPTVPATSNVASTIAGVESLLPVAYRPNGGPATVYHQLVTSGVLKVELNLVGRFTGARTGSAKCDAYLWAKETYLDSGKTNARLLAYYVDYFAATLTPAPAPPAPAPAPAPAPSPAPPAPGSDLLIQGKTLQINQSLVSNNGQFQLLL
jgi:hypothetical protein